MNPLQRFGRFTLVGAMGMALQLMVLAILHRIMPTHDLLSSAAALELTLLHNFTWHLRYTWSDRRGSRLRQCLRFHLSNGLLSMLGNLTIVAILLRTTHLRLLLANVIAIAACSLVNFFLGHLWAFAQTTEAPPGTPCPVLPCPYLLRSSPRTPGQSIHEKRDDRFASLRAISVGHKSASSPPRR